MSHRPPAARRPILLAALVALATLLAACTPQQSAPDAGAHPKLGAAPAPPGGLTLPAIFVDPQGSALDGRGVPCASDLNTGTQATCGGAGTGPLKTWAGVAALWGCSNVAACYPRLRQNTTVTFLSSQTDNTDPVYLTPSLENGAWFALVGNLGTNQTLTTTTLASVTAKNRSTPQLLQAAFSGSALDGGTYTPSVTPPGQLVVNTTHSSRAWLSTLVSGSTYVVTQPLAPITIGSFTSATEVDTWANGDSVTVYQPVAVDLVRVAPTIIDINSNTGSQVYIESIYDFNPTSCGTGDSVVVGRGVLFADTAMCRAAKLVDVGETLPVTTAFPSGAGVSGFVNTRFFVSADGGYNAPFEAEPVMLGGSLEVSWNSTAKIQVAGMYMDNDVILNGNASAYQTGNVYIASGKTFNFTGSAGVAGAGSGTFWGSGTVNAAADCRVAYPAGASKAAATFTGVTLNANGQTKTCLDVPSSAAAFATCNITLTAANLDTNLGGTTGCLVGAGAAFCNAP